MFQALARDRLERLNASPSATPWTYFRVYSVLLLVLSVDFFWYCLISPHSLSLSLSLSLSHTHTHTHMRTCAEIGWMVVFVGWGF